MFRIVLTYSCVTLQINKLGDPVRRVAAKATYQVRLKTSLVICIIVKRAKLKIPCPSLCYFSNEKGMKQ